MCPSVCLILLNIMFSVIIHVAENDRILSFQRLNSVLLSMCSLYFFLSFIHWWMFMVIPYLGFMNVVPVGRGYRCPLNTWLKFPLDAYPAVDCRAHLSIILTVLHWASLDCSQLLRSFAFGLKLGVWEEEALKWNPSLVTCPTLFCQLSPWLIWDCPSQLSVSAGTSGRGEEVELGKPCHSQWSKEQGPEKVSHVSGFP